MYKNDHRLSETQLGQFIYHGYLNVLASAGKHAKIIHSLLKPR